MSSGWSGSQWGIAGLIFNSLNIHPQSPTVTESSRHLLMTTGRGVSPDANCELWTITPCHCGFICGNKCTRGGAGMGRRYGGSLYLCMICVNLKHCKTVPYHEALKPFTKSKGRIHHNCSNLICIKETE